MISKLIGKKLKQKREFLNLPVKKVAADLGISPRAYLDIESGLVDIKASKLVVLKDVLQLSIAEMFEDSDGRQPAYILQNINSTISNAITQELLSKVARLCDKVAALETAIETNK